MKRARSIVVTRQSVVDDVIIEDKFVRNTNNDNDDEEIDFELETLEVDFQNIETTVEKIQILESFSTNAKLILESPLLLNISITTSAISKRNS